MANKKGSFSGILIISICAVLILAFGFGLSIMSVVSNNIITPFTAEFNTIGDNVSGTNFTDITRMTLVPVQASINSLNYIFGIIYMICCFLLIGLAVSFRSKGSNWMIPVFLMLAIFVILISIVMSNAYEDLYNGSDIVATGLQAQTLLSYGMIYAPLIMAIIIFIAGIIMFTGGSGLGVD